MNHYIVKVIMFYDVMILKQHKCDQENKVSIIENLIFRQIICILILFLKEKITDRARTSMKIIQVGSVLKI